MNLLRILTKYGLEKVGLFYSSYRGYVVENRDTSGRNRVMLSIPILHGKGRGLTWANQKGFISGKDYGFNYIPEIGEMVWVEFEFGRPDKPIYTPAYFLNGYKPKELDGNKIGFKSPQGNLVVIDEDNAEITIKTKDGTIILNDGQFEGLVKVKELTTKLNNLEEKLNTLITKYDKHTHPGVTAGPGVTSVTTSVVASQLTKTKQEDIENTKVKH